MASLKVEGFVKCRGLKSSGSVITVYDHSDTQWNHVYLSFATTLGLRPYGMKGT